MMAPDYIGKIPLRLKKFKSSSTSTGHWVGDKIARHLKGEQIAFCLLRGNSLGDSCFSINQPVLG